MTHASRVFEEGIHVVHRLDRQAPLGSWSAVPASAERRHGLPAWALSAVSGAICAAAVFSAVAMGGVAPLSAHADDVASSAVTVTSKQQDASLDDAPMPDLAVTVSQTRDLGAQGIELSWTGAKKSTPPSGQNGGENFLQIFQCWGDLLDATGKPVLDAAGNRQPDRTTCQYGGYNTPGAARDGVREPGTVADEDRSWTTNAEGDDPFVAPVTAVPFRSATGKTIAPIVDGVAVPDAGNLASNEFYTAKTTNEVSWAGSGADGSGVAKFELQTAMQSTGLGCGASTTDASGATIGAGCWLVVVPRPANDVGQPHITGSGLFWDAWKHRLAVHLDFKPIGVRCAFGAAERQLAGSELAAIAVRSWQPSLCTSPGGSIYSLLTGSESDALVAANTTTAAPLALASEPLDPDRGRGLVYAPIGLTGVTVGFAIDQNPLPLDTVPAEVKGRAALPFSTLKLTPRLIAKLLSASYRDALPYGADLSHIGYKGAADAGHNALNLTTDPDFLAVNDPAWAHQGFRSPGVADLLIPQGRSDAAQAVWQYVLADGDARAFLAGDPDPWGMTVNPWYSTDASKNPSGFALTLPREDFPKADPVEAPGEAGGAGPVNLVTWRPYTNDLEAGAYLTLRGDNQQLGSWDSTTTPPKYTKAGRDLAGSQKVLSLTDSSSAQRYQVLTAELRNPAGAFVAADAASLTAAARAMTPADQVEGVVRFDPASQSAKAATEAYPLALPVYAAANRDKIDQPTRAAYASFIRFVSTSGQEVGTEDGQLPPGYAPIPAAWADQARAAADLLENGATSTATSAPYVPAAATAGRTAAAAASSGGSAPAAGAVSDASSVAASAATGASAAALSGGKTPNDPDTGAIVAAVPASAAAGLIGAIGVPLITRLRRRLR